MKRWWNQAKIFLNKQTDLLVKLLKCFILVVSIPHKFWLLDFVPLEDRHCTKTICRRKFFGATRAPEIKSIKYSCADTQTRFVNDVKEKLRLRKLCWETMFGQVWKPFDSLNNTNCKYVKKKIFQTLLYELLKIWCRWKWPHLQGWPKFSQGSLHLIIWQSLFIALQVCSCKICFHVD